MEEVPFDDRQVPRVEVDWERSIWWWYPLTRAVQPAVRMNALVLGLLAIGLSIAGLRLGEWLFAPAWRPSLELAVDSSTGYSVRLPMWVSGFIRSLLSFDRMGLQELGFLTFEMLWLTFTFALIGGVLARRSLVELGQRTIAAWGESCGLVLSRWQSFFWSMGMHFVGIAAMLTPIFLLGLVSRLGAVGATLAGVLLLVCFPLAFAIGRFVLSAILCFPLSVCAIVAERKADAFEGFSRSNAYLFQRPVVAAICAFVLLAIGSVGEQLVFWTLASGWWLIRGTYLFAGGGIQPASNDFIAAGNWLSEALIACYWFSFFWSGAAATYLVLRKSVDNTEIDELDLVESSIAQSVPSIPPAPLPTAPQVEEATESELP